MNFVWISQSFASWPARSASSACVQYGVQLLSKVVVSLKGSDIKKEALKICPQCEKGYLHAEIRDVTLTRHKLTTTVKNIAGAFCDHCDEIEFDGATDSPQRYAQAGDQLVLENRATVAAQLKDSDPYLH